MLLHTHILFTCIHIAYEGATFTTQRTILHFDMLRCDMIYFDGPDQQWRLPSYMLMLATVHRSAHSCV